MQSPRECLSILAPILIAVSMCGCDAFFATPEELFQQAKVKAMSGDWRAAEQDCRAVLRKQADHYEARRL